MLEKTTYQHNHNGMIFTRTTNREYKFIAIDHCARVSWHSTEKSALAAARNRTAIREWPKCSESKKPYTEEMACHLLSKGVVLRQVVTGHHKYHVSPINNGEY